MCPAVHLQHLLCEKLLPGDPCGSFNCALSLWGLWGGHLSARLCAGNLLLTTFLIDLPSIFQAGWALEAVELPGLE